MSPIAAARDTVTLAGDRATVVLLDRIETAVRLPFTLKVLLENVVRTHDGHHVTDAHVQALTEWDPQATPALEIPFTPARVLMQDFTGVPAVVDLATLREAVAALGGQPGLVNPLAPAELVIDHSVIADAFGSRQALSINVDLEYERNRERYQFLRWGQQAFDEFTVVPPGTGIVHQVNIEHLARVVMRRGDWCYPDTVVGTDSHTTMVNGLGVVGWGVGGIEAEAAMLGQPVSMLVPRVVGFRLTGRLPAVATATDLVLTITEMLRRHGVVGSLVEFYGEGCAAVPLANRATIGNMSPEYGSTAATFPIDEQTLAYLQLTGRPAQHIELVEQYARMNGLWLDPMVSPDFSERLELDLATVEPSLAGPRRPQDRIPLRQSREAFTRDIPGYTSDVDRCVPLDLPGAPPLAHGSVVIAAITSCTNTSNPEVMIAAGLLARNAVERGLQRQPWVKTTLAPGSGVVTDYLDAAGLSAPLTALGFDLVGYGCTTCIGNSGPLIPAVSSAVAAGDLAVAAVLSGNRNFEGRINAEVALNYLASPPLVVAYALAGTMDIDLATDPIGTDRAGEPVMLSEIWPDPAEVSAIIADTIDPAMFARRYAEVLLGDERWQSLPTPSADTFAWQPESTYIRRPPYFDGMTATPAPVTDIAGARVLALLGDSVTTDHISPAGSIKVDSPAGRYLVDHGVAPSDFNSYGSRRGNHEVMIRGTFANIRLRNGLVPGTQGGVTRNLLTGEVEPIYDAAMAYRAAGVPLLILAGAEYGSGSSRDWAAKGTRLLGVRAVIAESFERIHRSNLVGMGVLPLEFPAGESAATLGLTGTETFDIAGIAVLTTGPAPRHVRVVATSPAGVIAFDAVVRIDTPGEAEYFRHGGILPFMARRLAGSA